jgi:hypothetical protein
MTIGKMALFRTLFLYSAFSYGTLAVTVIPLTMNLPPLYVSKVGPIKSSLDLLTKLNPNMANRTILYNSYNGADPGIYASQDSFVRGAIDAATKQQHFMIRPQDVWLTILQQLTAYLRKHGDDQDIKSIWDNLNGSMTPPYPGILFNVVDVWMENQFLRRDKTNWIMDWARPGFTSVLKPGLNVQKSTEEMMANALMMSFSTPSKEKMDSIPCNKGVPSVRLLGTQEEWKDLLGKLELMAKGQLGKEPVLYALILRPVLSRFVASFERPNDPLIRLFWNDMVTLIAIQKTCGTHTDLVTGWLNAFHFWDGAGNTLVPGIVAASDEKLELDGVVFPSRKVNDLPTFYSVSPMCVGDYRGGFTFEVLSGMLAKSIQKGMPEDYPNAMQAAGFTLPSTVSAKDHSMLQPLPAWIAHSDKRVSQSSPIHLTFGRLPQKNTLTEVHSLGPVNEYG